MIMFMLTRSFLGKDIDQSYNEKILHIYVTKNFQIYNELLRTNDPIPKMGFRLMWTFYKEP